MVATESSDGLRLVENLGDNPVCTVVVDESIASIVVVWRRYATSTQLRYIHEVILEMIQRRNLERIIGDDTALPTIHAEDQRWIVENWMPRAVAAGMRATASKSPASYFGRIAVQQVSSQSLWRFRVFDDMQTARQWLKGTAN